MSVSTVCVHLSFPLLTVFSSLRNWEGFGADPFLVGEAAYATVKGIQSQGVIATSKHFLAYEQETFRQLYAASDPFTFNTVNNTVNTYSAEVDDRTMHELYLKPFMNAVRAGTGAVMCVYNQINGTQGCENSKVLNGMLKSELNFQGFVVSDWSAVFNASSAVNAGVDVTMPGGLTGGYKNLVTGQALIDAVNNKSISMERVDDAIVRFLTQYYFRGQDKGYPKVNYKDGVQDTIINGTLVNEHVNVQTQEAQDVARQINEEAITLIYNRHDPNGHGALGHSRGRAATGTGLPLSKHARIAVFGSDAGPNPQGVNGCQGWLGAGSNLCLANSTSNGTNALGWGSGAGYFPYLIDPLAGLNEQVRGSEGALESNLIDTDLDGANGALVRQFAGRSDVSLVFVQARSGEDSDRTSLDLEANGDALIKTVTSASNNTIVVVHTVGPIWMDAWFNNPNITAVVFPHMPGQESGNTLADVLYGKVNPSGKMPYSILAKKDSDAYPKIVSTIADDQTIKVPFTEGLFIDYRMFDQQKITPLIHFGHGISYTTFEHSSRLTAAAVSDGSSYPTEVHSSEPKQAPGGNGALWNYIVSLSTTVKNTGSVPGKEVSQLYIGFPSSVPETPFKQLVGFQKTKDIQSGQQETVQFKVTRRDMSYWNVEQQKFVLPDGDFTFWSGASADEKTLKGKVVVTIKDGKVVKAK